MRTIKFRGLRTDGKGWVYGSLATMENLLQYGNSDTSSNVHIMESKDLEIRAFRKGCEVWMDNGLIQVHTESVGQFTGLCDKNGKEIFEGDKTSYGVIMWNSEKALFAEHFYQKAIQKWSISNYPMSVDRMEIIGNIHESPEPLNERV